MSDDTEYGMTLRDFEVRLKLSNDNDLTYPISCLPGIFLIPKNLSNQPVNEFGVVDWTPFTMFRVGRQEETRERW